MKEFVPVTLREQAGLNRAHEPLLFGVPLPKGFARTTGQLALTDAAGKLIPADITAAITWPDQSLRWVHVHTLAELPANSQQQLRLCRQSGTAAATNAPTARSRIDFTSSTLAWSSATQAPVQFTVNLTSAEGIPCQARCDSDWTCTHNGKLARTHRITGDWLTQNGQRLARFSCQVTTYAHTDLLKVEFCLHNPRRARHPGGLWDLGDAGSINFRSLSVNAHQTNSNTARLYLEQSTPAVELALTDTVRLHQESSGGEHWNSLNHIHAKGTIMPAYRGYRLTQGRQELQSGLRASPRVTLVSGDGQSLHGSYPKFWQNFPGAIEASADTLSLQLFPAIGEPYELQGGERKTQTLWFEIGNNADSLNWTHQPLVPQLPAEEHEQAEAFPWFVAKQPATPLDELVQLALNSDQNFFAKREIIDEYGWRNFGDIFADHETLYQPAGEAPLISHYNNQYDAIYGFARQFALTGDSRWYELMDDLARHVTDIDIYHTDEDRAEYNHGLFWHTDHYLPAHTASHRTFTRHNDTSSTPGQTGGGPAAEHCYTTGLLYHYLMTGAADSRSAVLDLAQWMVNVHDGARGLLAQLLAVKKQEVPKLKALVRGEQPSPHRYPFTRGTGNYLTALIDAAILEPSSGWLEKAEQVIRDTIHPADDIRSRNLLDVEIGWSYLILLSAMARYLWLKRQHQEIDEPYRYTREAFLTYTAWMQANERPFLQEPEQLEFANDTWVAQDIRKAMLLFNAAELSQGPEADAYRKTARTWLEDACRALERSPEKHFSRILIILAQNHGPQHSKPGAASPAVSGAPSFNRTAGQPRLTWPQIMARILQRLGLGITQFRPGREKAWLDARMNR